jgi:hypothetical protein
MLARLRSAASRLGATFATASRRRRLAAVEELRTSAKLTYDAT